VGAVVTVGPAVTVVTVVTVVTLHTVVTVVTVGTVVATACLVPLACKAFADAFVQFLVPLQARHTHKIHSGTVTAGGQARGTFRTAPSGSLSLSLAWGLVKHQPSLRGIRTTPEGTAVRNNNHN